MFRMNICCILCILGFSCRESTAVHCISTPSLSVPRTPLPGEPPNPGHHSRSWIHGSEGVDAYVCGNCSGEGSLAGCALMMRRARARAITLFDKTRLLGSSGSACFGFLLFLCFIVVGRSAERRPIADRASAADTNYNAERATALTRNDADAHPQDVCALRALKRAFAGFGRRRVRVVVGLARTAAPVTRHHFHISLDCTARARPARACVSSMSCSDSLGQRRRSHGIVFTFHSTVR